MAQVAVLMAEGFEEGETMTIVDILRRAGIECSTFSFGDEFVKGMHQMYVKADRRFPDRIEAFDALVLPGGRPGGANWRENPQVISLVRDFCSQRKIVAAMCSGTLVLSEAEVIEGKHVTGYVGYEQKLKDGIFAAGLIAREYSLLDSIKGKCQ